jgi:hypothetical protein
LRIEGEIPRTDQMAIRSLEPGLLGYPGTDVLSGRAGQSHKGPQELADSRTSSASGAHMPRWRAASIEFESENSYTSGRS